MEKFVDGVLLYREGDGGVVDGEGCEPKKNKFKEGVGYPGSLGDTPGRWGEY